MTDKDKGKDAGFPIKDVGNDGLGKGEDDKKRQKEMQFFVGLRYANVEDDGREEADSSLRSE